MPKVFEFGNFKIEAVELEREINFVITNQEGYVCRLVPGYAGLELSPQDMALGNEPDQKLISQISEYIVIQDA